MESVNSLISSSISLTSDLVSAVLKSLPPPKSTIDSIPAPSSFSVVDMPFIQHAPLVRLAGLCGAAAVIAGAYGSHVIREKDDFPIKQKIAFDTGNRYHMMHSLALMASPLTRYPKLTGGLFLLGMTLFSGGCYHYALTGEDTVRKVTPFGGVALILAWLSLVL